MQPFTTSQVTTDISRRWTNLKSVLMVLSKLPLMHTAASPARAVINVMARRPLAWRMWLGTQMLVRTG